MIGRFFIGIILYICFQVGIVYSYGFALIGFVI